MENVMVVGSNNEKANIFVVRYFNYNNQRYLIYTLNEKDESGYVKLYVSKITEQNGTIFANGIVNEEEWTQIKDLIKVIIKEVRDGNLTSVNDCNIKELENAVIVDFRAFKLIANIVEILSANKQVFEDTQDVTVENEEEEKEEENINNVFTSEPELETTKENETNESVFSDYGYEAPKQEEKPSTVDSFESLMGNSNNKYEESTEQPNNETVAYKELYEKLLEEKRVIEDELFDLRSKVNVIRNIVEQEK